MACEECGSDNTELETKEKARSKPPHDRKEVEVEVCQDCNHITYPE